MKCEYCGVNDVEMVTMFVSYSNKRRRLLPFLKKLKKVHHKKQVCADCWWMTEHGLICFFCDNGHTFFITTGDHFFLPNESELSCPICGGEVDTNNRLL